MTVDVCAVKTVGEVATVVDGKVTLVVAAGVVGSLVVGRIVVCTGGGSALASVGGGGAVWPSSGGGGGAVTSFGGGGAVAVNALLCYANESLPKLKIQDTYQQLVWV